MDKSMLSKLAMSTAATLLSSHLLASPSSWKDAKGGEWYCANNTCKGKSACGGAGNDNGCHGSNTCKGKGWIKVEGADAKALGENCTKSGGLAKQVQASAEKKVEKAHEHKHEGSAAPAAPKQMPKAK